MTTYGDRLKHMGGVPVDLSMIMSSALAVYFVDGDNGADTNLGDSWEQAYETIDKAREVNNATIDWSATPKRYNVIFIAPGVYPEELSFPYYCHVIGTGIRGTDTATEIHPVTGSCFAGTMLGTHLLNLRLEVNDAVPCLDVGICNNSKIEHCTFTNGAAVAATAIDTENCSHLTVCHCSVESGMGTGMGYGFYFRGGADKYAHNVRIHDNVIFCDVAGIWIQNTCTPSQFAAYRNLIARPVKGIDDNSGMSYLFDNYISASSDAIEHANSASQCVGNHVINNVTGAVEASGTD